AQRAAPLRHHVRPDAARADRRLGDHRGDLRLAGARTAGGRRHPGARLPGDPDAQLRGGGADAGGHVRLGPALRGRRPADPGGIAVASLASTPEQALAPSPAGDAWRAFRRNRIAGLSLLVLIALVATA